jgi:RimJ/RimL family protein N-acetyltransferase
LTRHPSRSKTTAFGIWVGDDLAGRVDLIRHTPERFGIGYWLGEAFTGRGVGTAAVAAAIAYARDHYGATDVFAGVPHGNERSVALLTRLGFCDVARFDNYTRFHVSLRYEGVRYE